MHRRPSFQAVGSVLACVVLLSAAGCNEDERSVTGVTVGAVEPTAAFGPGTGLGDGFEVTEGSTLIGAPIPLGTTVVLNGEPIVDDGWRAFLYVDGEPEAVVDAYLEQADERGLTPVPLPDSEVFAEEGEAPAQGWGRCGSNDGLGYRCRAAASDGDATCLTVDVMRERGASHLELALMRNYRFDVPCGAPAGVLVLGGEVVPGPPERWPALPGPGEPFGERWEHLSEIHVQEGSQVVAAPIRHDMCDTVTAALAVDGEPLEVLDRYVAAFGALMNIEPDVTSERDERAGVVLERRRINEPAGGRSFTADLVVDAEGQGWLYLSGCAG